MGIAVSNWKLANAVGRTGQLGVVSGVALDTVLARRLQLGDPTGDIREALSHFPIPDVAQRILDRYFVAGGIAPKTPFRPVPKLGIRASTARDEMAAAANFVEVYLAKRGHNGFTGVNYLEKIQLATPAAVYGAMLAGVDYVLMGAGIPSEIPALLTALAAGRKGTLSVSVLGAENGEKHTISVDPAVLFDGAPPVLPRPRFLAIVSSAILANYLARNDETRPDGFVVEAANAGGHSAPPRGAMRLNEHDEPVYGPRDDIDLGKVAAVGLPFWLAGGCAQPDRVAEAVANGAAGVQVGTAFALSHDSGLEPDLREQMLAKAMAGDLVVRNAAYASPTGFPFKMVQLDGSVAEDEVYQSRARICDLSYLRVAYRKAEGSVGYRCSAEPVEAFTRKGGAVADTEGRRCLCNGLMATIGLGQHLGDGTTEPPVLTLGQDLDFLPGLVEAVGTHFGAADVVKYIMSELPTGQPNAEGSAPAPASVSAPAEAAAVPAEAPVAAPVVAPAEAMISASAEPALR